MLLDEIQKSLFNKAKKFLEANTVKAGNWKEFEEAVKGGKMVLAPFCCKPDCEESIKDDTTATSRCIPFDQKAFEGKCVKCGGKAEKMVYFAKSY